MTMSFRNAIRKSTFVPGKHCTNERPPLIPAQLPGPQPTAVIESTKPRSSMAVAASSTARAEMSMRL